MDFEDYLHPEFIKLIEQIHMQGFKTAVVGGTVRDFYLGITNKHDYDCELRAIQLTGDLLTSFKKLNFDKKFTLEKLPYNVFRLTHPEFSAELTLPRSENYNEDFSHSNFEASFSNELDYAVAAKRRDFTINAMFYEFNSAWEFIDPFNGKKDVERKILRPCSDAFRKDPVRFLRGIRFQIKLDFKLDDSILNMTSNLKIEDFSSHYLRLEGTKSGRPVIFALTLFEFLGLGITTQYRDFLDHNEMVQTNLKDHLRSLIFLEDDILAKIYDLYDFSIKLPVINLPVSYQAIGEMDFSEFNQATTYEVLSSTHKTLLKLAPYYYQLLLLNDLVDLSLEELNTLNALKVDLTGVPNQSKGIVSLHQKIRTFFGK